MRNLTPRCTSLFLLPLGFLAASASLMAYPVAITINASLSNIGQPDNAHLAGDNVALSTTLESSTVTAGAITGTYPATLSLTLSNSKSAQMLNNQTGTVTIATSGQITAKFSDASGDSFSAVAFLTGVTLTSPSPYSFGTANFTAPASTVSYTLLGISGTVGLTGTMSALGLAATPTSLTSSFQTGGTAPAAQTISVSTNDPIHPGVQYSVAVAPGSNASPTSFLTLSSTSGQAPGTITATFSTSVAAGTYTANIQVNTTADTAGAPISIPVTYTVTTQTAPPPIPVIGAGGVTDGASFQTLVSPGSLATIFGTNMASSTASPTSPPPLPVTLGGVSVTVNGVPAPLVFASATQINFQVPFETVNGSAAVVVTSSAGASLPASVTVQSAAPGVFTYPETPTLHAVVQNIDSAGNATLNATATPASPGQSLVVYFTGGGSVTNPPATGAAASSTTLSYVNATPATATIGGVAAPVAFAGLTPGFVGLYQMNVTVPTLAPGDYPLVITLGTAASVTAAPVVSVGK